MGSWEGPDGRRTAVLHGLGGMGKTQLAIAYLRRYQSHYSATIWLNARDETSLQQSFAWAAELILRQYPRFAYLKTAVESRDLDTIADAVKRWLDEPKNDHWLLVYDNYDDPKLSSDKNRDETGEATVATQPEPAESPIDGPVLKGFDIRPFFPKNYQGAILVTTRSSMVRLGETVRLGKLQNVDDSLAILASTSHRQDLEKGGFVLSYATRRLC